MKTLYILAVNLLLIVFAIDYSSACDGYKIHINKIEPCNDDPQVISVEKNFTATLTSDCKVKTNGCIVSTGFKDAKAQITLKKNGKKVVETTLDVCNKLDASKDAKAILQLFGFPTHCPFPEERRCTDNKVLDFKKYKNMLFMAKGDIELLADVKHDTGTTCIKVSVKVSQ